MWLEKNHSGVWGIPKSNTNVFNKANILKVHISNSLYGVEGYGSNLSNFENKWGLNWRQEYSISALIPVNKIISYCGMN